MKTCDSCIHSRNKTTKEIEEEKAKFGFCPDGDKACVKLSNKNWTLFPRKNYHCEHYEEKVTRA